MSTTVGAVLRNAIRRLTQAGVSEPRAAAEVLLADLLALPRAALYLHPEQPLSPSQEAAYAQRLQRRCDGEPVQYITAKQEFWSLEFEVNPHVLIPRPESELLVEHGIPIVERWCTAHPGQIPSILDVGTGSGNVALSLARALPQSHVWAIDISLDALRVARRNAQRLGVNARLHWLCGDLLTAWRAAPPHCILCVSNLPYVTTAEWHELPREIRAHEPPQAFLGGPDGLDIIRRLLCAVPTLLPSGSTVLLEVGWQQAASVQQFCHAHGGFQASGVYHDYAGIARVVWAQTRVVAPADRIPCRVSQGV